MKTAAEYIELSFNNMSRLSGENFCSCYSCLRMFSTNLIEEVIEDRNGKETAICPFCYVDSLLPGMYPAGELSLIGRLCFGTPYVCE